MSNLTAIELIANNSAATTGLWNQRLSTISANFGALNSDLTINFPSGETLSVFSNIDASGRIHAGQQMGIGATPSAVTTATLTIAADSSKSDYIHFEDPSGGKSNYLIGSRVGGTADGLNLYDLSGDTMIASFSKQSIRFFQNVVGPVFDVGGALADTYNAATFGTGADSRESRIQSAIIQASTDGVSRVYVPANMYPYSASSISFINAVQMVREGGDSAAYDIIAYGATNDGSRSAASALQGALDGAAANVGSVYAPGGIYLIDSTVTVPSFTVLRGSGRVVTFVQFPTTTGTIFRRGFSGTMFYSAATTDATRKFGVQLYNFDVDGQDISSGFTGTAFDISITANCLMEDIAVIKNVGRALLAASAADWVFNRVVIVKSGDSRLDLPCIDITDTTASAGQTDRLDFYSLHCESNYHCHVRIQAPNSNLTPKWVRMMFPKFHDWLGDPDKRLSPVVDIREADTCQFIGAQFSLSSASFGGDQLRVWADDSFFIGTTFENSKGSQALRITGGNNSYYDCFINGGDITSSGVRVESGTQAAVIRGLFFNGGTNPMVVNSGTNTVVLPYAMTTGGIVGAYTVGAPNAPGILEISGQSGAARDLVWTSGGSRRWHLRSDATAEGSDNAGSALVLRAYSDGGGTIDDVMAISRTTNSAVTWRRPMSFTSQVVVGTDPTGTQLVRIGGNVFIRHAGTAGINLQTGAAGTAASIGIGRAAGSELELAVAAGNNQFMSGSIAKDSVVHNAYTESVLFLGTGSGVTNLSLDSVKASFNTIQVWARSGISVGNTVAGGGTLIPAISSTSSRVAAFVVQPSASSFTVIAWAAVKAGDQILTTIQPDAAVSSMSSAIVVHSHCTQNGQIEMRLSNVSTLAQNQSQKTYYFTRISPF